MSNDTPKPVRGTQDIFGAEAEAFAFVVETFERVRKLYRFRRAEMPVFERTEVFARPLGETTDVVSKEMYSFDDRGGESLTLRPEFTAGIARAFITNGWQQHAPAETGDAWPAVSVRTSAKGPLSPVSPDQRRRYWAPQNRRRTWNCWRWPTSCCASWVLRRGRRDVAAQHAGRSRKPRGMARGAGGVFRRASRAVERRQRRNGWTRTRCAFSTARIAGDIAIVANAPPIDDYLSDEAREFFAAVTSGLDAAGVAYERNPPLVRGFDYYRHTAFEFVTDRLGAQGTVLGGGRYDGLIETLGGPHTPSVGWAAGIERLAMLVGERVLEVDVAIVSEAIARCSIRKLTHL